MSIPFSTSLMNFAGPLAGNGSDAYRWDLSLGPSGSATESPSFQIVKRIEPRATLAVPIGGPTLGWVLAGMLGATAALAARRRVKV